MIKTMRVLEVGVGVGASYAARLLADQGAEVIKVDDSEVDWIRKRSPLHVDSAGNSKSGLFLSLNLNKSLVEVDLSGETGRNQFTNLMEWANVIVHSLGLHEASLLGIDDANMRKNHPQVVVLAVTPFGLSAPYSAFNATELTIAHGGGWAGLCPMTHRETEYPPLKMHGHHCSLMAGVAASTVTLAAYRDGLRSKVGEYIDFSLQEYVASVLEFGIHIYSYHGHVIKRTSPRSLIPWRIFDTKDGAIFLACIEQDQWERLVDFMGKPEWAMLDVFNTPGGRNENQDVIHTFVEEFIAEWKTFDLYHAAQKSRICFAPVMTFAQLDRDPHLAERNFFEIVEEPKLGPVKVIGSAVVANGSRVSMSPPMWINSEKVSELGKRDDNVKKDGDLGMAKRPLEGVRIVDMTWVWAGTFGTMNLAHLGADVIRVESSVRPDLYRRGGAAPEGIEPSLNTAGMFNQWNQGKRSVAVDLRTDAGRDLVKRLVREADVLVQNFATGVMARMGLGYDNLKEINPKLIMASISGYGQTGPYQEYMGYGPATGPLSGLSSVSGYPGEGPEETGVAMPDPTAGITAAYGVCAALLRRDDTGVGEHLDVTLWEATAALNIEAWMEYSLSGKEAERIGNRDPHMAPHGCYPALGEDLWVTIACETETQWAALRQIIPGTEDPRFDTLILRKDREDELDELVSAWTSTLDRWFITGLLQDAGIAAFPSFTCQDIVEDPHLNYRGFIERLNHPEVGKRAHTGIPWNMKNRPNGVTKAAPCLGGDTDEVLTDVLGMDTNTINSLRAKEILQ